MPGFYQPFQKLPNQQRVVYNVTFREMISFDAQEVHGNAMFTRVRLVYSGVTCERFGLETSYAC